MVTCSLLHLLFIKMDPFFEGIVVLVLHTYIGILKINNGGSGGDTVGGKANAYLEYQFC